MGASPAVEIADAASGDARKRISASAASRCLTAVAIAAEKKGSSCSSAGIAPPNLTRFPELLKADLGLAARDDRGHRLAGRRSPDLAALARHLVRHTELGKKRRREINPAAAVGVGDRLGFKERAPKRVDASNVRLRGAGAHDHADLGAGPIDLAAP